MQVFRAAHAERDAAQPLDLRDEAGERVIAARRVRPQRATSEAQLRAEVVRDVMTLLNTTRLEATDALAPFSEVQRSVLNFGLPDLAHRLVTDTGDGEHGQEIVATLQTFEPRLVPDSVKVVGRSQAAAGDLRTRFGVRALLRCYPDDIPVEFTAEVELDSGAVKISRI